MENEISKQKQQLLNQAQIYQQQLQGILAQKESLNLQLMEINKALENLEQTKEKTIYKISGPILIKSDKEEVKKDLNERKEMITLRIKTLEKGEKRLKEKFEELRAKISK